MPLPVVERKELGVAIAVSDADFEPVGRGAGRNAGIRAGSCARCASFYLLLLAQAASGSRRAHDLLLAHAILRDSPALAAPLASSTLLDPQRGRRMRRARPPGAVRCRVGADAGSGRDR